MRTTMDEAGRIVIPAALRLELGLVPGAVTITVDGAGLHIESASLDHLVEEDGRLVVHSDEAPLTDEAIRKLRDAGQR